MAINWNYSGDKARSVLCKSRLGFNSWSVKVVKTITDNENKMRAAFDDEERSECVAHILHSSITEGYKKITEVKEVIEKNRKIPTKYHKSYAICIQVQSGGGTKEERAACESNPARCANQMGEHKKLHRLIPGQGGEGHGGGGQQGVRGLQRSAQEHGSH